VANVNADYTSKDYDGFRASLLSYARATYPDWSGAQTEHPSDFGVMLVELFSYMGDILSFYGDRAVLESFLSTATLRSSVLAHAETLGYVPVGRVAATGTVTVNNQSTVASVIPAGTKFMTDFVTDLDSPIFFESTADVTIAPSSNGNVTVSEGSSQGTMTITVNDGTASQQNVLVELLGTSDGTIDQVFVLRAANAIDASVRVFSDEINPNTLTTKEEYTRFLFIVNATPLDLAYELRYDDKGIASITFGDGVNGIVPPAGTQVYAAYQVGVGVRGNLPSAAITEIASAVDDGISLVTSSATTGGTDEEDTQSIRTNAPLVWQTQNRAVTVQDYANLALATPSVSKAKAVSASAGSVSIFILGPGGNPASSSLMGSVQSFVQDRCMAGTTVSCLAGTAVPVNLGTAGSPVVIGVNDRAIATVTKDSVNQALITLLSPINRDFGKRVTISEIYRAIANVPGVDYAIVTMMARADATQSGTSDAVMADWEIPSPGTFYLTAEGGIA
jgi:uncharacterized phage protein gp47/JayE